MKTVRSLIPENNRNSEHPEILIVDDSKDNLEMISHILSQENYRFHTSSSGVQALEMAESLRPDLILLDIMIPEIDGYEVCNVLKSSELTNDIPVIFISAKTKPDDKILGFDAGAVDYITKPFHRAEMVSRIRTHLALKFARDDLHRANQEIQNQNLKLEAAYEELQKIARTDSLTKLSNRRDLYDHMETERSRFHRNGKPFVLMICDIDNFKHFNDTYGHDCGDYILVTLSTLFTDVLRKQDTVGRWGGEEFLFMLPETGLNGGLVAAEKIRSSVADYPFEYNGQILKVTITAGVALYNNQDQDLDFIIKQADEGLYQGKKAGKNRVVVMPVS